MFHNQTTQINEGQMDILKAMDDMRYEMDRYAMKPDKFAVGNLDRFKAAIKPMTSKAALRPGLSYAGIKIMVDEDLPDDVVEIRNAAGEVLQRIVNVS